MRRAAMLRVFGDEPLKRLANGSERGQHRRGSVLVEAGEPAGGATLVLFGLLDLRVAPAAPSDHVAGVGSLLDGVAMVVEAMHGLTASARVETEVLFIPRDTMLRVLAEFPENAKPLQDEIALRSAALIEELTPIAASLREP
jgi:CRP-like cAMP-binding protein